MRWRNRGALPTRTLFFHIYLNAFEGNADCHFKPRFVVGAGYRSPSYNPDSGCCVNSTGASCSCTVDGEREIDLNGSGDSRNYVMGHEYGHGSLMQWPGGYTNDSSLGSGHGRTSLEYTSCAAMEGWAHFVAADIWNSHPEDVANPGAWFRYWSGGSPWINVESGQPGYEQNYLENNYGWLNGRGVELDRLRHWWDYHTNGISNGVDH